MLRCILNSAARKMWVCVWDGRAVVVGGNLSYFCLLPANLRGGRVVTGPLEVLLPAGNVVSGVYIVYALFLLSARWSARWSLRVVKKCTHINIYISAAGRTPAAFLCIR